MATNVQSTVNVDLYSECSVCGEGFKDPRTLACGHYFCRGCIEGILRLDHQGSVKCPTCRAETKVTPASGVKGLQRPRIDSVQEMVTRFLLGERQVSRLCDVCTGKQLQASQHCYKCTKNICQNCCIRHNRLCHDKQCVEITDSLFCGTHDQEVVIEFCQDCNKGICAMCLFNEHADHQVADITPEFAAGSRQRLSEFVETQSAVQEHDAILRRVQAQMTEARKVGKDFTDSVATIRRLLKDFEEKLNQVELETKTRLAAEMKTLALYEADIKVKVDCRRRLVHLARRLTQQAPDHEVVEKEVYFTMATTASSLQHIAESAVELPVVDKVFPGFCSQLQQMLTDCKMELNLTTAGAFRKQQTVTVSHAVRGLTIDQACHRLVARTVDPRGPLKVYSYDGKLVETLGAGVQGLAPGFYDRGICMDTARDCYLAPCHSSLVVVSRAGQQVRSIRVGGEGNHGVAYGSDADIYAITDSIENMVYVIDPATSLVTRKFGSPWSEPALFKQPHHIHVGTVASEEGPCIVVSDYGNHCIKLFDTTGSHIRTYGSRGSGKWQLGRPCGVCTDGQGRVVVCDRDNHRVVIYWTDRAGQDRWSSVKDKGWAGCAPWHVALDVDHVILGVIDGGYKTLHVYTGLSGERDQ